MDGEFQPTVRTLLAAKVWASAFGLLFVLSLGGVFGAESVAARIRAAVGAAIFGVVFTLTLVTLIKEYTRRIAWNRDSITETHWFGTRIVPWEQIASFERENSAAARQANYDEARRINHNSTRSSLRPRDIWVWVARDHAKTPLLTLEEPDAGEPQTQFVLLRDAVLSQVKRR
jgi:hypothetical protein